MKFLKKYKYYILLAGIIGGLSAETYWKPQLAWYWIGLISIGIVALLVTMVVMFWIDLIERWG